MMPTSRYVKSVQVRADKLTALMVRFLSWFVLFCVYCEDLYFSMRQKLGSPLIV